LTTCAKICGQEEKTKFSHGLVQGACLRPASDR
jgi:hypothetical protein